MTATPDLSNGAQIDATGRFRYRLWRTWNAHLPRACVVMLNPSTADGVNDDPTLRRCIGFARRQGFGGIEVVNLFALRTPSPLVLRHAADAAGEGNAEAIATAIGRCDVTVAAWGIHGGHSWQQYRSLSGGNLLCLGETRSGAPRHPLYVPGAARFRPWRPTLAVCPPAG